MKFSEKVFYLRKKNGLTQCELAQRTNITQPMIFLFEADKRKPTTNTAIQLAKVLGVEYDDLMNDERSIS